MSVSSTIRKVGPYLGNGVTVSLPFPFKVFKASEVVVTQTDADGVGVILTITTDYTVTLNVNQDNNPGGTVDMHTAPGYGFNTTLTSNVEAIQDLTLTNQGGFYPKVINDSFDRITIVAQQIINRLNLMEGTVIGGGSIALPPPQFGMVGQVITIGPDGTYTLTTPVASPPPQFGMVGQVITIGPDGTYTLTTPVVTDLTTVESNIVLNAFRIAINGSLTLQNMIDGFVDEYNDETGVDVTNSVGQEYDNVSHSYNTYSNTFSSINPQTLLFESDLADSGTSPLFWSGSSGITYDTASPREGSASLILNGSSFVSSQSNSPSLNIGGTDFYVRMWVRTDALGTLQTLASHGSTWTWDWMVRLKPDNKIQMIVNGSYQLLSNSAIGDTGWHYIEVSRVAGVRYLFIDGVLDATDTNAVIIPFETTNSPDLSIGAQGGTHANKLSGAIDSFGFSASTGGNTANYSSLLLVQNPSMTLISNPKTALAAPTKVNIKLREQDVDVVTLNTDLVASVRAVGTNLWTPVTLTNIGEFSAGVNILDGTADISAQQLGVDLQYKIEMFNARALKILGVSLSWG